MLFKSVDRAPFAEVCGYWDETILRWHCEGLPIGTLVTDYFGFDEGVISPFVEIPLDMLLVPRFVEKTLGEDDRHRVIVDKMGITKRILKTSSSALGRMPQYLDWPVKTIEDFRKIRERFNPEDRRRIGITWSKELIAYYNSTDVPIGLDIPGFYGIRERVHGYRAPTHRFYKDPELVTEIFDFWGEFIVKMIPKALPFKIDYAEIWEDMAYRNGPNISPKLLEIHFSTLQALH